jgi:hypothetical protein
VAVAGGKANDAPFFPREREMGREEARAELRVRERERIAEPEKK